MKIAVMAARYAFSGVPLAQLRFARALARAGHEVDFIIGAVNAGYQAPQEANLTVRVLNKRRVLGMLWPLIRYFRRESPQIAFSAGDHLNVITLLATQASASNVIVSCSSRVTPFDTYSNVPFTKPWVLKYFMRALIPRADALTCVSEDMVEQYSVVFKDPPHVCVYNIVDDADARAKMDEPVEDEWFFERSEPLIVAAGSLEKWKGFGDLVAAMDILLQTRRARLAILGDGPLRGELQALIAKLDIGHAVRLLGYVENPLKYFSNADIFVLSSHVEGLPNVLVEAMMCGCTPVSTNCPTGPREVLADGKYGYLVPVADPVALAAGIARAIDEPIPKELLREAIVPFSESTVIAKHFEVLGIQEAEA